MTVMAIAVSSDETAEIFSIVVSQAVQYVQTVAIAAQRQIMSAVAVVTKSSQTRVQIGSGTGRRLTAAQRLWRYRSAGIIGITAIGLIASLVHPGPATGAIFPFGLWLWWLRYRELVRR